jgi:hypothetical protein
MAGVVPETKKAYVAHSLVSVLGVLQVVVTLATTPWKSQFQASTGRSSDIFVVPQVHKGIV